MLFERIYDEGLAQASYFIGCERTAKAVVIDARRDVGVYLEMAEKRGMRIVAVTETHVHADYLSGSRELAAATGATLYVSGEGDCKTGYAFEAERLRDGDGIRLGGVRLKAVHTPGHTPEHISFLLTDPTSGIEASHFITGDFVFVGDIGRPDLLDRVAGGMDTRFAGARRMYRSLRDGFLTLPDWVQVWPGHGSGSACGRSLGSLPVTTVGYERLYSWWAGYLERGDEKGFVEALLEGQPDAPSYFRRIKRANLEGPMVVGGGPGMIRYSPDLLLKEREAEEVLLVDTRSIEGDAERIAGAIRIPAGKDFAAWAAWAVDPDTETRPLVLLVESESIAVRLRDELLRVGLDDVSGYLTSLGVPERGPAVIPAGEVDGDDFVLDVRSSGEHADGALPGAVHIHAGRVVSRLDQLPRDRRIVVYCQAGARAAVVASVLRNVGFEDVVEVEGGYPAWKRWSQKEIAAV